MGDAEWAVLDVEVDRFRCRRCGGTETVPTLPMELRQFVDVLDGFARRHADCKEPELADECPACHSLDRGFRDKLWDQDHRAWLACQHAWHDSPA